MTELSERVEALDVDLFSSVDIQASASDARCLLALHAAFAATRKTFTYLEIGSYRGGSLQVLIRDPRCSRLMSIDPRTGETPDETRGAYTYQENTTARMLELLSQVPGADMEKLSTFETTTEAMTPAELPHRPDCCFIDGEHSHAAVLQDVHFCAEALRGAGVIAFHDYGIVQPAIRDFVRERWRDISFALPMNRLSDPSAGLGVFALELGDGGILRHPAIQRATGARAYAIWRAANRPRRTAAPFLMTWAAMPTLDSVLGRARDRLRR
jgi:hypothetical protein